MYQRLFLILLFGSFLLCLVSCKTATKLVDKTELKSGNRYTYRIHRDTDIEIDIAGRTQISTNKQTFHLNYEVLEVLPDGSRKLELTYGAIKIWQVNGFRTLQFNSETDGKRENLDFNQQIFQKMLGKKVKMTLGPRGEVVHFKGASLIIDDFFKDIKNIELLGYYRAVREQMGDLAMKELLKQLHSIYPPGVPVQGEVWETETSQLTGLGIKKNNVFQLKKSTQGGAVFLLKSSIEPEPNAREVKMGNSRLKFLLKGDESGEYNLEGVTGRIKNAVIDTALTGTAKITGSDNSSNLSTVSVKMETVFELLE